jgi:subfamily B ATP-binding cassette protein HlyB/CyaB
VPKGLQVDEVVNMGQHAMHMSLVKDEILTRQIDRAFVL